jgi:hypothetical protein
MRRPGRVTALAVLCVALAATWGCGSGNAPSPSSSTGLRHLINLNGFALHAGQTYRVTFTVDAPQLRILAFVRGGGPAPGDDPELRCRLEKVGGSAATSVPLQEREHAGGRYWTYAAETTTPLTAGTYRITLSGDGRLQPFGVTQL